MLEICFYFHLNIFAGGTADITVHEVQAGEKLREIHHVTGGAWGGTKVDDAFYQFLAKIFGNNVLTALKDESLEDYLRLFRDFETKKRTITPDMEEDVTITLPFLLMDIFRNETQEKLSDTIKQTRFAKTVKYKNGKLKVKAHIFKDFFDGALQGIVTHIDDIMKSFPEDSISIILLVGGFSESNMVLKKIRELFPDKKVITPADPGLAVLKGAVLFGYTPTVVSSRISRYTIGLEVNVPFIDNLHRYEHKFERPDGKAMCQHIFESLVQKGEHVCAGHKKENTYTPSEVDAITGIGIYQSTSQNPVYTTEKTCSKIGTIVLRKPNGGWSKDAQIHAAVEFGGTQFDVALTDDCLDETYRHSYDFLTN